MFQAMHIPYACLGHGQKAMDLLAKAEKCVLLAGKVGNVFSVKTYTYVSVEEFLASNQEMVTALRSGRLWDGMVVPSAPNSFWLE